MEPGNPSPYPQVPATCPYPEPTPRNMSLFRLRLRDTSSRNTPPLRPGNPNGGEVYLRIVLSPEEASQLMGNS
jgi:hypothetical protein